jgi:hypothetical protein
MVALDNQSNAANGKPVARRGRKARGLPDGRWLGYQPTGGRPVFTSSAYPRASRVTATLAVAVCGTLFLFGISSANALASTSEVPTASSTLAAVSATSSTTEAVGTTAVSAAKTTSASCEGQTFSQSFEAFGDYNYYTLVAGSQFNSPEEGWELTGGARILSATRPDGSIGGTLQLPKGAAAVSPPVCVTLQYPSARVWLRKGELGGSLTTLVAYTSTKGTAVIETVAKLQAGSAWKPSEPFAVRPELGGESEGARPVRFVFTSKSERESSFQLYGLYVDPRMS